MCDRACKDCCCNINTGKRPARHHAWEYFEEAGKHLYGIERLHLTGGEPTTHPLFERLANEARGMFGCKVLTLQTDGFKAERYADALKNFDHIYASRYDDRNRKAVDFIQINYPTTTWEGAFTPRSTRGSGKPCARGFSETVAYADGKLWPCCVAPGIEGAASMEPCSDWIGKIESVPLACETCWFSPQ